MEAHLLQRLEGAGLDGFWRERSEGFGALFHPEKLQQIWGRFLGVHADFVQRNVHLLGMASGLSVSLIPQLMRSRSMRG